MKLKFQETKYLKKFMALQKEAPGSFKLRGDSILIELLKPVELTTNSGLIMATKSDQMIGSAEEKNAVFGLVLLTGSGFEDEPMDLEIGNLVLLPRHSTEFYSFFPGINEMTQDTLGRCSAGEVKFFYKDFEAFDLAQGILN